MAYPALLNPDNTVSTPSAKTAVVKTESTKTVTTAGTAVRLTASYTPVSSVVIFPLKTNTGAIYVGTIGTSGAQHVTAPVILAGPDGKYLDLNTLFIDAEVNGEGVAYITLS